MDGRPEAEEDIDTQKKHTEMVCVQECVVVCRRSIYTRIYDGEGREG